MNPKGRYAARVQVRDLWIRIGAWGMVAGALIYVMQAGCRISVIEKGRAVKELNQAKGIYLALKMYAADHNGRFPHRDSEGHPFTNANEAYRTLIPDYVRTEKLFYSPDSAWTPKEPDNEMEGSEKLAAGENAFAYVTNLTDVSNPAFPIVVNGFAEGTPGIYSPDPKAKGGLPKGRGVVIVRVDGSGKVEAFKKLDGNLFKPVPGWLAPDQVPLNPEG